MIDFDHPVDEIETFDAIEVCGTCRRMIELRGHGAEQGVVDQGGFAGAGNARDAGHQSQREFRRHVLQIVGCRADHAQHAFRVWRMPLHRNLYAAPAAQVLSGDRIGIRGHFGRRALRHDAAAMDAGAGTQVHDVISLANRVLIVFDHDHRVAEVAQIDQRVEQALIVALVQADRRLIQYVHDADQPRADLTRETDALRLAAGQSVGAAIQGEIAEGRHCRETPADRRFP